MKRPSIWTRGYFDVPAHLTESQVSIMAPKYKRRFGQYLEAENYQVLQMLEPVRASSETQRVFGGPETKRYAILAQVTRKPVEIHVDIPDYAVPEMQRVGLTLQE